MNRSRGAATLFASTTSRRFAPFLVDFRPPPNPPREISPSESPKTGQIDRNMSRSGHRAVCGVEVGTPNGHEHTGMASNDL